MKSRVFLSLIPALLVIFTIAGSQSARAADVHLSIGSGHGGYGYHEYRTADPVYQTWYPDSGTSYVYSNNGYSSNGYSSNTYTTPYVYSTPSVEFGTWYGDGYRNRSGSYGRGGYGGGGYSSSHGRR